MAPSGNTSPRLDVNNLSTPAQGAFRNRRTLSIVDNYLPKSSEEAVDELNNALNGIKNSLNTPLSPKRIAAEVKQKVITASTQKRGSLVGEIDEKVLSPHKIGKLQKL